MVEGEAKMRGPLRNLSNLPRTDMQRRCDAELAGVGKMRGAILHVRKPPRCASHDEPLYAHATETPRTPKPDDSIAQFPGVRLLVMLAAC